MPPKQANRRAPAAPAPAPEAQDDDLTKGFKNRLEELPLLMKKSRHRLRNRFPEVKFLEDFKKMLPPFDIGQDEEDIWTQEDENELQREWSRKPLKAHIEGSKENSCKALKALWKKSLRFFRCAPYDLLSEEHHLAYQTCHLGDEDVPDPMWSDGFCKAMTAIMSNSVSNYHAGAFATIIQYAVICRTNDQRRWPLKNYTDGRFLDWFLRAVNASPGNRSIVYLHDRVEEDMEGLVISPWSQLFRAIEGVAFKQETPPIRGPEIPVYQVTVRDLRNIEEALNSVGASGAPPAASMDISLVAKATKSNNDWPVKYEGMIEAIKLYHVSKLRQAKIAQKVADRRGSGSPVRSSLPMLHSDNGQRARDDRKTDRNEDEDDEEDNDDNNNNNEDEMYDYEFEFGDDIDGEDEDEDDLSPVRRTRVKRVRLDSYSRRSMAPSPARLFPQQEEERHLEGDSTMAVDVDVEEDHFAAFKRFLFPDGEPEGH